MVGYVDVRAYAELNEFVELQARGLTVRRPFRSHQTVKDVLEAMGIPHTEVDLILVNGDPADFSYRPVAGDRIAAYPMFEASTSGRPPGCAQRRCVTRASSSTSTSASWRGCFGCWASTHGGRVPPMIRRWPISAWASSEFC